MLFTLVVLFLLFGRRRCWGGYGYPFGYGYGGYGYNAYGYGQNAYGGYAYPYGAYSPYTPYYRQPYYGHHRHYGWW